MNRREFIKLLVLRTAGNFLILFVIFGFFATFGPAVYYEISYRAGRAQGIKYKVVASSSESGFSKILQKYRNNPQNSNSPDFFKDILSSAKEKILIPPDENFSIVIPKIGAAERIQENVDPSNEKEYLDVLTHSIAHAKGTSFPGLAARTYIFAHSADNFWNVGRYNAVFYLLKELENNDDIFIFFKGKRFNYKVFDKKIVDADDVQFITQNPVSGEEMVLQTCWPPGTAWKRLLIFARPKV